MSSPDRLATLCLVPGCTGVYHEASLFDDWEGYVTCDKCWERILRYDEEPKTVDEPVVAPSPTYHDLHITMADMERTSIFNLPYNVEVSCTRVGGWNVIHRPNDIGTRQYLAGDANGVGVILDVAGHVIFDNLTNSSRVE